MPDDRPPWLLPVAAIGILLALTVVVVAATGTAFSPPSPPPAPTSGPAILVGAGDIAECDKDDDEATARLLDKIDGTVFTAGDNAYPDGTAQQFTACYAPSWGRHRDRTRPAAGNHEYHTPGAAAYFAYFGAAAGDPTHGYYAYDLGAWRVIVLNSECDQVGGCAAASPQVRWLRDELAAHPTACTLAIWHKSRFSSGDRYGDDATFGPFWEALYDAGAEVVVSGHDHDYERFAPQTSAGVPDPDRGIREFVVGTGGGSLRDFGTLSANSEVRHNEAYGVIKFTLLPGSYRWEFLPVPPATSTDAGGDSCH